MLCTNLVVKQLYTDVQLLNSLFQKAYGKVLRYAVTAKKLILNVSKIRLRLICARVLYVQNGQGCPCTTAQQAISKSVGDRQKAYGKFFQNRRVNTSDRIDKNRRINKL